MHSKLFERTSRGRVQLSPEHCPLSWTFFSAFSIFWPFSSPPTTTVNISATATMLSSFLGLAHFHFASCCPFAFFSVFLLYNFYCPRIWRLFFCFLFSALCVLPSCWPSVPCLAIFFAALLIVQTWHYCFLRPTTGKHNVNRGQGGVRPGHIWVKAEETPLLATPLQSTLPYRQDFSAPPLLTIRRFSIVCKCAKLKAGKARNAREPGTWNAVFEKGNFPRSSQSAMFTFSRIYLIRLIRERAPALGKA